MRTFEDLSPFEDAMEGLRKIRGHFRLVALSNGEQWLIDHLVEKRMPAIFDKTISVQEAGVFKPHPAVYRTASRLLDVEPEEIMMVSSHSFDVLGARACGYYAAYVNRYELPREETPHQPNMEVADFIQLAARLASR